MAEFVHHPDGYISLDGLIIPLAMWAILEPDYTLPEGYGSRVFTPGVRHHLFDPTGGTATPADINWPEGTAYMGRILDYAQAKAAIEAGAHVVRQGEAILIYGPPELTPDKAEVIADGADVAVIICDVMDDWDGEIVWTVIAPDGSEVSAVENLVNGVATLELIAGANQVGWHTVRAAVAGYGVSSIGVKAV